MDRSHSPSTSSFAMRQTSLSDLLAGVHGGDGFASFGLSRLPMLPGTRTYAVDPMLPGTRTYAVDPEDPFGNIPPVEPPRPEYANIAQAPALTSSSAAAVPPPPLSSAGVSSQLLEHSTPPPPRRSQRLAASARTNNTTTQNSSTTPEASSTPPESRKRKSRATASAPPRKRAARKKPPPNIAKDDSDVTDDRKPAAVGDEKDGAAFSCCICMCEPEKEEVSSINGCDHLFCFDCIGKWADRENTCPLCKSRFTSISRVHKAKKRKGEKQSPNSKRVKQRDQRADVISGPAIEAMLANIAAVGNGTQSRFGRFLVALGSRRPPTLVASSRRTTLILEDDVFSDETDDDELPMINFNSLMRRATHNNYRPVPSAAMHFDMGFGPLSPQFAAAGMPPPPPPQPHQFRTYATNTFEQNAGTPSNPLEIDLDDDDDDDSEVEVFDGSNSA